SADADWIREKIVAKSLEPFRMIEVRSYKFAVRSKAGTEQQLLSSCLPPIQPYLQSVKYGRIFSASQSPDAVDLRPLRSSRAHSAHFAMSYFDLVAHIAAADDRNHIINRQSLQRALFRHRSTSKFHHRLSRDRIH